MKHILIPAVVVGVVLAAVILLNETGIFEVDTAYALIIVIAAVFLGVAMSKRLSK
ncbi:hypothetical protein ACWCOP_14285 [Maricaulaceae bacterium MS644]